MSMNAQEKVARHRLSVLQLAQSLGSVSEECRQRGMTRTQFYDYKRRFEIQGLDGLKDLLPIHKTHPQTTPPEVVEQIIALSLAHPAWGCVRLSEHLKLAGVSMSSPTVQDILIRAGMGRKFERLLKLEEQVAAEGLELSPEQVRAVEKSNPCFRKRHVESSQPGELLAADTYYVGKFNGIGKVYLHCVVDTYMRRGHLQLLYLWLPAHLQAPRRRGRRAAQRRAPLLCRARTRGGAVLTDNGREFCGTPTPLPGLNDLEHRRTKVHHPQTNGFVERFQRTLKEEFFGVALRETLFESVETLQAALDTWLAYYNTERPHLGYRNHGRRPLDTIVLFTSPVRHEG